MKRTALYALVVLIVCSVAIGLNINEPFNDSVHWFLGWVVSFGYLLWNSSDASAT